MPEGHTLHRLATDVFDAFGGRPVTASSPQGRFAEGAARIDGRTLVATEAHGKHLLANDTSYADLRGATVCELLTTPERDVLLGRLGPDPLRDDADPDLAWTRIRRSRLPIGQLLMEQAVLSGVGNVYRAETLFRARLHPLTPGRALKRSEWDRMWADLVELMRYGVETGRIDTVDDEHTPDAMGRDPRRDDHGGEVYVYRRQGEPCHVCRSVVRTQVLAGRNLFWCPKCQRTGLTRRISP